MLSALVVPLALSSFFTAGCVLIHNLRRYAEQVGKALSLTLLLCAMLCFFAVAERHVVKIAGISEQQVSDAYASRATAFDPETAVNWSD